LPVGGNTITPKASNVSLVGAEPVLPLLIAGSVAFFAADELAVSELGVAFGIQFLL
jgi:hypothetical protein